MEANLKILRFHKVAEKTGLSKSSIRGRIKQGDFPSPIQLGPRAVGFVEAEVNDWLQQLINGNRAAVH
jgi:prophage regulatory protein